MQTDTKKFILATFSLIGTIIGVGIFGVGFALGKIGLWVGLGYFVVLTTIQLLQHLFFAEAAIACPDKVRLVGLTERYLGKSFRHIAALTLICGFWASILAYVIVGGTFLHTLLAPFFGGDVFIYRLAWGAVGAAVVYFGLNFVTRVGFVATLGLLAAMAAIIGIGAGHVRPENLALFGQMDLLLPYGLILFSLSGPSAITEMEDIIGRDRRRFRMAVIIGTLTAAVLTLVFGFVVLGVTGSATSEDSIMGLGLRLGSTFASLMAVFGFLAVATSYFSVGTNLRATFEYDYRLHRFSSWLLAVGVPLLVFLLSSQSFVRIISFSGAVFGGINAIIIALLFVAVSKKKLVTENPLRIPHWVAYVCIAVLASGAAAEIYTSFFR